ncbi:bifunctional transcriptional activator/DNA repair enzyme AdaA [Pseudomonas sp. Marseille-QA0892]
MLDTVRCWHAVRERDERFDGQFVFAVRSTQIYCRPSCPARRPRESNVAFFPSGSEAKAAGYRACFRCSPDGPSLAEQMDRLVEAACKLLDSPERVTLDQLSARIGVSSSHLARAFKARTGLTPRAWAAHRRALRLQATLPVSPNVLEASLESGYTSTRELYEKPTGMRPSARLRRGQGETLHYTLAPCALGYLLVAVSERGVCAVLFDDTSEALVSDLRSRFAAAALIRDDHRLQTWLNEVLAGLDEPSRAAALPLDLRGSAFQLRVWDALQSIPAGETRTYGALAADLASHPRAIARACASNSVGLLVPCHRVVAANGQSGGYRWGLLRKAALLANERRTAAQTAAEPSPAPSLQNDRDIFA